MSAQHRVTWSAISATHVHVCVWVYDCVCRACTAAGKKAVGYVHVHHSTNTLYRLREVDTVNSTCIYTCTYPFKFAGLPPGARPPEPR